MAKDYHIILGVSREANPSQIKHAYRRIAKQLHPDLAHSAADAEKFIEIKEAYDTLTDAEKRRRYDAELQRRGSDLRIERVPEIVRSRRRRYQDMEALGSFLDDFFEGFVPGVFPRRRGRAPEKDIYLEVVLSLRESRQGGLFPISFPVWEACPRCGSKGVYDEFFCPVCFGYGSVQTEREFSLSIPPHTASGSAVSIALEDIGLRDVNLHVLVQVDPSLED